MKRKAQRDRKLVSLGFICGVHGLKGWIKVHSWTRPREAILNYQPWLLGKEQKPVRISEGALQGKRVVALLPGSENRAQARDQVGLEIAVFREQMPELSAEAYYWTDLEGLSVVTKEGAQLGHIERMMETPAHDVMVITGERERLIPFVWGQYVISVDLDAGHLVVDWDPEFGV